MSIWSKIVIYIKASKLNGIVNETDNNFKLFSKIIELINLTYFYFLTESAFYRKRIKTKENLKNRPINHKIAKGRKL